MSGIDERMKELKRKSQDMMKNIVKTEKAILANFNANVVYIIKNEEKFSQDKLAELVGCNSSFFSRCKKPEENNITVKTILPVALNICQIFDISLDDLLNTRLGAEVQEADDEKSDLPVAEEMKLTGLYRGYYFDPTGLKKGRNSLSYCLILVHEDKNSKSMNRFRAEGIFNMSKMNADAHYRNVSEKRESDMLQTFQTEIPQPGVICPGEVQLTENHIYFNFQYQKRQNRDKIQLVFYLPEEEAGQYAGGLGTMNAVTKGLGAPGMQYIELSKDSLDVAEEEIASWLRMHYQGYKTAETNEQLIQMMMRLYQNENEGAGLRLTEEEKKVLVHSYVDQIVYENIEQNMFRAVYVSKEDNEEFCQYLKRVKERKKRMKNGNTNG